MLSPMARYKLHVMGWDNLHNALPNTNTQAQVQLTLILLRASRTWLKKTPVDWHWQHVASHQDDKTDNLDQWAVRNIQMDAVAKDFWKKLHDQGFQHSSCHLPYEGWTMWLDTIKLTSMNRSCFNEYTQSQEYSTAYWKQPNKLGIQLETIDWNSTGKSQSGLAIWCQIWMTKWATGWLPMGKNMKQWKQWPPDQCPVCKVPHTSKTVKHLYYATIPSHRCWSINISNDEWQNSWISSCWDSQSKNSSWQCSRYHPVQHFQPTLPRPSLYNKTLAPMDTTWANQHRE